MPRIAFQGAQAWLHARRFGGLRRAGDVLAVSEDLQVRRRWTVAFAEVDSGIDLPAAGTAPEAFGADDVAVRQPRTREEAAVGGNNHVAARGLGQPTSVHEVVGDSKEGARLRPTGPGVA